MTTHYHSTGMSSVPITGHGVIYGWDGLTLVTLDHDVGNIDGP
jgi:hypothetical protein